MCYSKLFIPAGTVTKEVEKTVRGSQQHLELAGQEDHDKEADDDAQVCDSAGPKFSPNPPFEIFTSRIRVQ
jgi:hypothetical protein